MFKSLKISAHDLTREGASRAVQPFDPEFWGNLHLGREGKIGWVMKDFPFRR